MEPENMTPANKEKCLALAKLMDEVQALPGGVVFVTELLIGLADRCGLALSYKGEVERLRGALQDVYGEMAEAGTDFTEGTPANVAAALETYTRQDEINDNSGRVWR